MRSPNAAALTKVQTRLGTEPVIVIEVDWTDATLTYADKDFFVAQGKILLISGLDAIVKLGSSGASGDVNIVLDDADGTIKTLLNNNDIHKRPARIYQNYEGLLETDKFLLFSGQVSSPIVWDEGQRTIAFSIVNIIEDRELGFAPEDGDLDFVAEDAIGVPWPLAFGDAVRVPAVKLTSETRGTNLTNYGQITLPEVERLCALAITSQQADTAKAVADNIPGFTDGNYGVVLDNLTSATISLNEFLAALVFDSPTQETNLNTYIATCKEIERWRNFVEENVSDLAQAEADITPLESTSGKSAKTVFKFFVPTFIRNRQPSTVISFTPEVLDAYRVGKDIPKFEVTVRGAVPANVGLIEQAQIALNAFIAANWVYDTPEEWAQDAALNLILSNALADLNNAIARRNIAEDNISLGNANIVLLNATKKALEDTLTQFILTTIIVDGGEDFPQSVETEIVVNGLHYKGIFASRTFTISQANTPANVAVEITATTDPNTFQLTDSTLLMKGKYLLVDGGITFCESQNNGVCSISPLIYEADGIADDGLGLSHTIYSPKQLQGTIQQTSVYLSKTWLDLIRGLNLPDSVTGLSRMRQRDYGITPGDTVYLASDFVQIYVANLIPSTAIHEVMAFRVINGERKLVPIPTSYYTVTLSQLIAGQNATVLRFRRPLTEYFDEAWEDQVFVSLTSSVGPNTVDIIEHLVDTYTDLTKDSASFSAVKTSLTPFPSNFAFLDRRGTLGAIEDIAWQARSVAYVKGDTIFLKYLAIEDTPVDTIDETVADRRTFELTMTPTESLVTEFCALWDANYAEERRNQIILRNNIEIYGTNQQEFDFFIYNIQSLVVKSATFWLIRMSNTWKIARFKTPLNMLRLEAFDTVTLDFGQNFIASAPVDGIVEEVIYDSENYELEFAVKTPIRSGKLTPYVFFWPSAVDISIIYPTAEDEFAGR